MKQILALGVRILFSVAAVVIVVLALLRLVSAPASPVELATFLFGGIGGGVLLWGAGYAAQRLIGGKKSAS